MYSSKLKDVQVDQTKQQDFPIACETCFGDSPYMNMIRAEFDKECKICSKPFTVFRWKAGTGGRFKKTEICKTCSLVKNVCQVCIHDLEFGLPVQVRDAALQNFEKAPVSDINRAYTSKQNEIMIEKGELDFDNFQPTDVIEKLARSKPNYTRNQAHVCSFFLKGDCNRGSACPYRHDSNSTGKFPKQNIKDRYYGNNDPVAMKMLEGVTPQPPDDKSITTLFLGNVDPLKVKEDDLRASFFSFGVIKSLRIVAQSKCAFITFDKRESAETAMDQLFNKLIIDDCTIRLNWSKQNHQASSNKPQHEQKNNNNQQHQQSSNNNNSNGTDTAKADEEEDDDEGDYSQAIQSIVKQQPAKPAPTIPKPSGIKVMPSFKINPTPQGTSHNKPYYSAMDPNSYGGRL
ncbi:hypothetical protein SAMD00019534_071530 [Acytostelium subglobosum LB1]|uniref:hypothetical protein n=1 Tax=Acytostelium subglobosum LB1 TaxID=1410327 RepID=UPI000644E2DE|nr:hypothetical protein SAMD00019534_071530 [Acytostelium subglobosum LB1]GAM23978.1 hypothetical protein SAMD00019534_071530 [Acytostelium subglobosum LB1]|eukprot:XP_012753014.1 hypothetical protein SAMD00019534_071530 [Acytostelium subglobosum LB1]